MTGRKYLIDFLKSISGNGKPRQIIIPYYLLDVCEDDYDAAALLNQILFWMDTTKHPDKWYARSYEDIKEELRMSKFRVMQSMKVLKPLGVETKTMMSRYHSFTRVVHYRISDNAIETLIKQSIDQRVLTPSNQETQLHNGGSSEENEFHGMQNLDEYYYKSSREEEREEQLLASAHANAGNPDDLLSDAQEMTLRPESKRQTAAREKQAENRLTGSLPASKQNVPPINATTPPPKVAPKGSPVARKLSAIEREIMTLIAEHPHSRVTPTERNMNCAASLCDDGLMICEKVKGMAFYTLTDEGRTLLDAPKKVLSAKQLEQEARIKALSDCGFAPPLTGPDFSNYNKKITILSQAGITPDLYPLFVGWVGWQSKAQSNWDVTLNSLVNNNRPSEFALWLETPLGKKSRQNGATSDLGAHHVGSMLMNSQNVYNPINDPAYGQRSGSAK